jgi:putative membrane protein
MNKFIPRNYRPWVIGLSVTINVLIVILFFLPASQRFEQMDLTIFPLFNGILNGFTFVFLSTSLWAIKKKDIKLHRGFIFAAFSSTALFLISYITYHVLTEPTPYGGEGAVRAIYFFILITHILLAAAIVPLALTTLARGITMQIERHRRIARWTMPLWLYVSSTGVIVYLMIRPYY